MGAASSRYLVAASLTGTLVHSAPDHGFQTSPCPRRPRRLTSTPSTLLLGMAESGRLLTTERPSLPSSRVETSLQSDRWPLLHPVAIQSGSAPAMLRAPAAHT